MRLRFFLALLLAGVGPGGLMGRPPEVLQAENAGNEARITEAAAIADHDLRAWRDGEWRPGAGVEILERGVSLARDRANALRRLASSNPSEFARRTMSEEEVGRFPIELRAWLERRVSELGTFEVFCALPKPDAGPPSADEDEAAHHAGLDREVRLDGNRYHAFVFGSWEDQTSFRLGRIEGILLDDYIVLGDGPAPQDAGDPVVFDSPNLSGPNTLLYIIARFSDETSDPIDDATAQSQMQVVNTFWQNNSSGTVSIRGQVNSADVMDIVHVTLPQPRSYGATYNSNFGQLLGDARSEATAAGFNYANYNLDVVVTSDQSFSYAGRAYVGGQGAHLVRPYTSLRTAGHELGHNLGLYHASYWRSDSPAAFGKDSVPGGYVADSSNAEWVEYGHYFSVMSAQSGSEFDDATKPHYAAVEKARLGWLTGAEVEYVNTPGTFRLFRHDHRTTTGTPRAIRVDIPATDYTSNGRRYWLNFRYAPWNTAQSWFRNGLQIDAARTSYGGDGAVMLDLSPYSKDAATPFFDPANRPGSYWTIDNEDKRDGALIVGRTFSDKSAGIHVTPVALGDNGAGEEYIDVVIQLGQYPGNQPPRIESFNVNTIQAAPNEAVTFSVVASDPDGDALAYAWDFDQVQVWTASGLNASNATKSWPTAGQYRVTATVSDMKGGVTTESVVVTVGTPGSIRRISGRVLWAGQPVYGARVSAVSGSTTLQAFSESDGTYTLTDLSAANNYTLNCVAAGLTFTAQFSNPVGASPDDSYGQDFHANEPPSGGGGGSGTYAIRGQVTEAGTGVAGVEVSGGGKVTVTDSSGDYSLTGFPNGDYTVTAERTGWTFSPTSRSATVNSADFVGASFTRQTPHTISGRFYGVPASSGDPAPRVWLSNGRSVVSTRSGTGQNRYWSYSLGNVPAGEFSLSAELSGYRFTPSGFTNPLQISGNRSGLDFNGTTATVGGTIAGRVLEASIPRPGVLIEAREAGTLVGSTTTDTDGYYRIPGLAAATHTVSPTAAGLSFTPSSRTVASIPALGVDFAATGSSQPPSITDLTATPSQVPSASETTTLAATATGAGPLTYHWAATSGPYPVAFSANHSSGASSTVVAFTGGGDYNFRVRVIDANGLSNEDTVAVSVTAAAGAMVISPYEVVVPVGQAVVFRADAWDGLGGVVTPTPLWSVDGGGTINASGVFTATTVGGPYVVTATDENLTATATVLVSGTTGTLPQVSVTALLASVNEASGSTATVRLSRTGSTSGMLTVAVGLSGSAAVGTDFGITGADSVTSSNVVVTFAAGAALKDLALAPIPDALGEGNESVIFGITGSAAYTAGSPATTTVMIVDAALPRVSVAGTGAAAEFGAVPGAFTVSRSGAPNGTPLVVRYGLGGSAVNGEDYTVLAGSVTITAGADQAQVDVVPLVDGVAEGDETVVLTLTADAAYVLDVATNASMAVLDRPFDKWRHGNFDATELQQPGISGETGDPDGDGIANLMEYALGLDPKSADAGGILTPGLDGDHFTLSYRESPEAVDVAIDVEASVDLPGNWGGASSLSEVSRVDDGGRWLVTLREQTPITTVGARYFRLRVRLL